MHEFPISVHWHGSTAGDYARDGYAQAPGKHPIAVSSAPAYLGNPARWNPEDMFGAALATCHMLTFFALAKKAGLDVRAYDDNATATLETIERVTRISKVRLAPTIAIAGAFDAAKATELFEKAHKYCFIAASTTAQIEMAPTFVAAP